MNKSASSCFSSKPDMSRLRLAAACALLKLAQEPCYHEIITLEQYQLCALVINVRTAIFNLPALCFQLKSFSVQLIFIPPLPLLPDIVPFHPPHHRVSCSPCPRLCAIGWVLPGATVFCPEASPGPVPSAATAGIHGSVRSVRQGPR